MGYVKDLKSGNIISIEPDYLIDEIELRNQELIGTRRGHLIRYERVKPMHEIIEIKKEIKPKPEIKKPGRKPAKK